jgi:hypothetical protein
MAAFDATSAISEFLADSAQTSLQLPQLTTGQRKHMKTLIAQHPELRCDSYGMGSERRLHVFKSGCEQGALKSSIDSTPQKDTLGSVPEVAKQELSPFDMDHLHVRNTFIHIETETADERVVQSMPHGMFRQCLMAEMSYKTPCKIVDAESPLDSFETEVDGVGWPLTPVSDSEPEAESTALAGHRMPFGLGALVVVEGLTKLPAFNGLSAVVQGWDQASERYSIMLVTGAGACHQAKIKEENLRLLLPCP